MGSKNSGIGSKNSTNEEDKIDRWIGHRFCRDRWGRYGRDCQGSYRMLKESGHKALRNKLQTLF